MNTLQDGADRLHAEWAPLYEGEGGQHFKAVIDAAFFAGAGSLLAIQVDVAKSGFSIAARKALIRSWREEIHQAGQRYMEYQSRLQQDVTA